MTGTSSVLNLPKNVRFKYILYFFVIIFWQNFDDSVMYSKEVTGSEHAWNSVSICNLGKMTVCLMKKIRDLRQHELMYRRGCFKRFYDNFALLNSLAIKHVKRYWRLSYFVESVKNNETTGLWLVAKLLTRFIDRKINFKNQGSKMPCILVLDN